jgi:starch phosphorylase
MDGANVEIYDAVGEENIIIFGMSTPEVNNLKNSGYKPTDYFVNNENAKKVVASILNGIGGKEFPEIVNALTNHDPYMVMADFADYQKAQDKIDELYRDEKRFAKMGLMNIACSGIFAADRSIDDYARDIWNCKQ